MTSAYIYQLIRTWESVDCFENFYDNPCEIKDNRGVIEVHLPSQAILQTFMKFVVSRQWIATANARPEEGIAGYVFDIPPGPDHNGLAVYAPSFSLNQLETQRA